MVLTDCTTMCRVSLRFSVQGLGTGFGVWGLRFPGSGFRVYSLQDLGLMGGRRFVVRRVHRGLEPSKNFLTEALNPQAYVLYRVHALEIYFIRTQNLLFNFPAVSYLQNPLKVQNCVLQAGLRRPKSLKRHMVTKP